jgi:hypothetical protein
MPYAGNRPWADVVLNPGSATPVTLKCLVDTGADYLQVNAADLLAAGISVAGAPLTRISGAAGTATLPLRGKVPVTIEGSKVLTVDVVVDTGNATRPPLAGRQLLLAAFDLGFNVREWLST